MTRGTALNSVAALLLLAVCASARAQDPGEYILGPEDVIEISVRNHPDLDKVLTILPDGVIAVPEAGEIKAAGKTPRQLAGLIQEALGQVRNNVHVTVAVKEIHSRQVRIVGAVRLPNAYAMKSRWRVVDLVAVAGGLAAKPAKVTGRVIREGSEVIPLDLQKALAEPDSAANVPLKPGDLVLLDEIENARFQYHVMGQVAKPGAYDLDTGLTLLSALAAAGYPTDRAALSKAYVMRGSTQIPVNLRTLMVEGRPDPALVDFRLQAGDVLYLPEVEQHYAVMGMVAKPGSYYIGEKAQVTVLDAYNQAGGQLANGDLGKAGIIRMVNGKPTAISVNIDAMLKKADLAKNVVLEPNDILYIPEKGRRGLSMSDVLAPISALSVLGFRLFRY